MAEVSANGSETAGPLVGQLGVQVGTEAGHPVVLLNETGALSQHTIKMSPDLADSLAELLSAGARRARLGLVLPPGN